MDFAYVKSGIGIALIAVLFCGLLYFPLGCCEHDIKNVLKSNAQTTLADQYSRNPKKVKKSTTNLGFISSGYIKFPDDGAISIVLALLSALLNF